MIVWVSVWISIEKWLMQSDGVGIHPLRIHDARKSPVVIAFFLSKNRFTGGLWADLTDYLEAGPDPVVVHLLHLPVPVQDTDPRH